jgi:predicted ester cyclase
MKKLFLLAVTLIMFTACQQEQRYFSESPEIDSFKASISEYGSGNWEAWHSHFADTAKLYINSLKSITATDLENAQKEMLSNFSSYGFQDKGSFIEMVLDSEDETWVYYWANWHGTLKANGQEIDVPVHLASQYVDGKVVELHDYYDSAPITVALAEIEKANNMPLEDKAITAQVDKLVSEFFNNKNMAVLSDVVADNYVRYMNDVKVASNPQEFADGMNVFFTGFPDFNIKLLHRSPIFDNTQFTHWQMTGTNTGEFAGSPATGKKVKITGLSRVHFNGDGKVDEENVFYNELDLMKQLEEN